MITRDVTVDDNICYNVDGAKDFEQASVFLVNHFRNDHIEGMPMRIL